MDPWDLFKPIVLVILVCNFDVFVLGPVNGLCGIISRESADIFNLDPNRYLGQWSDNLRRIGTHVAMQNYQEYQEELLEIAEDFQAALHDLIRDTIKQHKRIISTGDNYS